MINNVGITLDMVAPLFGSQFLYIVCFASVCKALCGVAAGATVSIAYASRASGYMGVCMYVCMRIYVCLCERIMACRFSFYHVGICWIPIRIMYRLYVCMYVCMYE